MENFRIESLEINKIGAFEHLKMDFPEKKDPEKAEIHILTGENGTGKSTVLLVLTSIADDSNEKEYFARIWNKDLSNYESTHQIFYTVNNDKKQPKIFRIKAFRTPHAGLQENLNSVTPINYAFFSYSSYRNTDYIFSNKDVNINPFKDAVKFTKPVESGNFLNWILTTKTKALVVKDEGNDTEYNAYLASLSEIEKALCEITEKSIEFVLLTRPSLNVALKVDGIVLSIDVLPDGIKSTITWLGDLLMRLENITWIDRTRISLHQNFILFLDEIEVHLHPAWQRKILPVVQKLFKNAQIFISTHSPFVVGSVDGAWVHKLKKDGAYAVLDGEPILTEDAESYDTILEEVFGIKERFGIEIESKLVDFRKYTREILSGNDENFHKWEAIIEFFKNQRRPEEIMSLISPQIRQINRILKQVPA